MEKLFYEFKPILCLLVAVYTLLIPEPPVHLVVLSMVLAACGAWILRARLKARQRGSLLENLFYEGQPYFYIGLALWAVATQRTSKIALASAIVLFFCASVILKWRKENRG